MPSAAFTTLGCKVNQYETQKILESFEEAGFAILPFDAAADVYVINTCSVTSIAESKSRYTIRRATRNNPKAKVVVTGCATQMALNKSEEMDGADVLVPNPEKLNTLNYFLKSFPEFESWVRREPNTKVTPPVGRTRATLKIQDGCSVMCSYCSIPHTRPKLVSSPFFEVIDEANKLIEMGYHELVLTGVLIGAYGPESGSQGPDFEELVGMLSDLSGDKRIRISSIEMRQVTSRLIDLIKDQKVVPHLHIPLQSGDSQVLKDMNRPYTQEDYTYLCYKLYEHLPDFSLTTDIMVGFPTETEERFISSLQVCDQVKYLKAHIFRFSPRWGTPADQWGDPIKPEEKQSRSLRLTEIAQKSGEEHKRKFLGRTMRTLVEAKPNKSGLLEGLTDNYLEVRFAGPENLIRKFVWVTLHDLKEGILYGELSSSPQKTLTLRQHQM